MTPEQRALLLEHRRETVAAAELVAQQVRELARRAQEADIDSWFRRVVDELLALIAAGFAALRRLAEAWLGEDAALAGRTVDVVSGEWNTEQVRESMRVTGPVMFKDSIAEGVPADVAVVTMADRMAASAQRHTMAGQRRTVEATVEASGEIVGWRRVSDGDPCAWCAMLVGRGAVYEDQASAQRVVGRAGRARGNQALGSAYHDGCGCTAVPLYEHEDEPDEVDDLYRQWQEVTAGKSGPDAIRAWRAYWDGRQDQGDTDEPIGISDTSPTPAPVPARPEPVEVPELARRYHRSIDGLEDIARAVERGEPDEVPLTGGVSADTRLATFDDGVRLVRKIGGNPAAEQAASMIGRALGLRVPRVYRNSPADVWMEYIADARPWEVLAARGADPGRRADAIASDDGKLIGLLDILIGNGDRNAGNWMLTDDGQVVPIDHGHAFLVGASGPRPRPVWGIGGPFAEQYWDDGRRPGPNDLTSADVETVRARLEALRPDFQLIDRESWLDYALAVLRGLAPHASGTRDLVGEAR